MSKIGNGGPDECGAYGMTLRDWFAGQALRARWGEGLAMTPEQAAQIAYMVADAMLGERNAPAQ